MLSKLCIMNTLLHFLLLFQFGRSLRNISLGDCILGKSNVIITVGWVWWRHQRAPFLVLPRAPPTLNPPLPTTMGVRRHFCKERQSRHFASLCQVVGDATQMDVPKKDVQCYGKSCTQCFLCKETLHWTNVCFSEHGYFKIELAEF